MYVLLSIIIICGIYLNVCIIVYNKWECMYIVMYVLLSMSIISGILECMYYCL